MRRLLIPLAAAALVACSDAPSTPASSLLTPRSSLRDALPPPPTVSGDGFADFSASEASDASAIACPAVRDTFRFAYDYFNNGPNTNAYLHIRVDGNGLDIAVHETTKKLTANGTLDRPTFSFQNNDVLDGTITNKETGVPGRVVLSLTGLLTVDGQTCVANATLSAQLTDIKEPPPVDVPPVP